jgi:hypothetical protein
VPLQEQVQVCPVPDQPEELQEYVVKSEPQADWPQFTVTGKPPGPVPLHWQFPLPASLFPLHAWPVHDQPLALHE